LAEYFLYIQSLNKLIMTNKIKKFLLLMEECKIKLPILAEELDAVDQRISWTIKEEDGELECRGHIGLVFGEYSNYNAGSFVRIGHGFEEAAKSIREYHAEWLKEETKRQEKKQVEQLKEQLYNDYVNSK
jgi:hypothetical protein